MPGSANGNTTSLHSNSRYQTSFRANGAPNELASQLSIREFGSTASRIVSKAVSVQNFRNLRISDAKVAALHKALLNDVKGWSSESKVDILTAYGISVPVDRKGFSIDEAVVETLITNLPEGELDNILRQIKIREEDLVRKFNKNQRDAQKSRRKALSGLNLDSRAHELQKLKGKKLTKTIKKTTERGSHWFRSSIRKGYNQLQKELREILKFMYSSEGALANLAEEMEIDFDGAERVKRKDIETAIIAKILLYVDLVTGRNKKGVWIHAYKNTKQMHEILRFTSYAWVTGEKSLSLTDLKAARASAKATLNANKMVRKKKYGFWHPLAETFRLSKYNKLKKKKGTSFQEFDTKLKNIKDTEHLIEIARQFGIKVPNRYFSKIDPEQLRQKIEIQATGALSKRMKLNAKLQKAQDKGQINRAKAIQEKLKGLENATSLMQVQNLPKVVEVNAYKIGMSDPVLFAVPTVIIDPSTGKPIAAGKSKEVVNNTKNTQNIDKSKNKIQNIENQNITENNTTNNIDKRKIVKKGKQKGIVKKIDTINNGVFKLNSNDVSVTDSSNIEKYVNKSKTKNKTTIKKVQVGNGVKLNKKMSIQYVQNLGDLAMSLPELKDILTSIRDLTDQNKNINDTTMLVANDIRNKVRSYFSDEVKGPNINSTLKNIEKLSAAKTRNFYNFVYGQELKDDANVYTFIKEIRDSVGTPPDGLPLYHTQDAIREYVMKIHDLLENGIKIGGGGGRQPTNLESQIVQFQPNGRGGKNNNGGKNNTSNKDLKTNAQMLVETGLYQQITGQQLVYTNGRIYKVDANGKKSPISKAEVYRIIQSNGGSSELQAPTGTTPEQQNSNKLNNLSNTFNNWRLNYTESVLSGKSEEYQWAKLKHDSKIASIEAKYINNTDEKSIEAKQRLITEEEARWQKQRAALEKKILKENKDVKHATAGEQITIESQLSSSAKSLGLKKFANKKVQPVYIVNKEVNTDMLAWTKKLIEVLISALKMSVILAPIGFGLDVGLKAAGLLDTSLFATGASGHYMPRSKAKSGITQFISGDSLNGKENKEKVSIDWNKRSYEVKPIPEFATGGSGSSANSGRFTRMTESERKAPMAVSLANNLISYTRKIPGDDGSPAVKVFSVNPGITDVVDIGGGTSVSLMGLLYGISNKLDVITGINSSIADGVQANATATASVAAAVSSMKSSNNNNQNYFAGGAFPSELDTILQGG